MSQLPDVRKIETVYVKLQDGRIVARTSDELAALPDELRSELVFITPGGKGE